MVQDELQTEKFRNFLIVKGKVAATGFSVAGQAIPTVVEELDKSLDRVYDASLTDKDIIQHIRDVTESGLPAFDKSRIIGKFKVWWVQFKLIPRLFWLLLITMSVRVRWRS